MAVVKKTLVVLQCERCEHEWLPKREGTTPVRCPHCKSPYWNTPRRKKVSKTKTKTKTK